LLSVCIGIPVTPDPVPSVGPVKMANKWPVNGSLDVFPHSQTFPSYASFCSAHFSPFVSSFLGGSGFVFASTSTIVAIPSAFALFASSSAGSVSVSRPPKSQSSCSSRIRLERSCAARIYVLVLAGDLVSLYIKEFGERFRNPNQKQADRVLFARHQKYPWGLPTGSSESIG